MPFEAVDGDEWLLSGSNKGGTAEVKLLSLKGARAFFMRRPA